MLRKLLLSSFLLLQFNTEAQNNIQNISFTPQYPGPLDSVNVIVDLMFTSGSCELQFENHSVNNDSIRINLFHCPGPLTVICYVTDTINLGLFPAGSYVTEVIVHTSSWSAPDPCTDVNPSDSGIIQITVLPGSGISHYSIQEATIYYLSQTKEIVFTGPAQTKLSLLVFNSLGALVLKEDINSSVRLPAPNLIPGVYLFQLFDAAKNSHTGEFSVH